MSTKTRILTNPEDITCPDGVIDEWLKEWNNGNSEPVKLEDLDDMTYDFIYRAVDYGANQELLKGLDVLMKISSESREVASELLRARRPLESTPEMEIMKEIETLRLFVIAETHRLQDRIKSMGNVSK